MSSILLPSCNMALLLTCQFLPYTSKFFFSIKIKSYLFIDLVFVHLTFGTEI